MQDIAVIEESIELLSQIGRLAFAQSSADREIKHLTVAHGKAVSLLYHNGERTIGEFAAGLGIGMPAASELIDRLEERGLISRSVDPADRRRTIIALSGDALDFAVEIHDKRRRQMRDALDRLEPEERPIFLKSLRALATALEESYSARRDLDRASDND